MEFGNKGTWRQEIARRLAGLEEPAYQKANCRIKERFFDLDQVREAKVVMIYYSINREVATVQLIESLLGAGKQVVLPVCTPKRDLEARQIQSLGEVVETGKFGLKEPGEHAPIVAASAIDLSVIPGVAFDTAGNRLGHGMGYYDRFLSGFSGFKLGLAYDFQVVSALPVETHDVKMDALLTPERFWDFTAVAGI